MDVLTLIMLSQQEPRRPLGVHFAQGQGSHTMWLHASCMVESVGPQYYAAVSLPDSTSPPAETCWKCTKPFD